MLTILNWLDIDLWLVAETASNPNVNFSRWCKNGNTSQLIEHIASQSLTVVHVLA